MRGTAGFLGHLCQAEKIPITLNGIHVIILLVEKKKGHSLYQEQSRVNTNDDLAVCTGDLLKLRGCLSLQSGLAVPRSSFAPGKGLL